MLMPDKSISELNELLSPNIPLHIIIENEVNQTPYGTITFTMQLKDGQVIVDTLNIVKNRRLRYNVK